MSGARIASIRSSTSRRFSSAPRGSSSLTSARCPLAMAASASSRRGEKASEESSCFMSDRAADTDPMETVSRFRNSSRSVFAEKMHPSAHWPWLVRAGRYPARMLRGWHRCRDVRRPSPTPRERTPAAVSRAADCPGGKRAWTRGRGPRCWRVLPSSAPDRRAPRRDVRERRQAAWEAMSASRVVRKLLASIAQGRQDIVEILRDCCGPYWRARGVLIPFPCGRGDGEWPCPCGAGGRGWRPAWLGRGAGARGHRAGCRA